MKDEILKIINTTIYYSDVTEGTKAADELQHLMCYREVKAYWDCLICIFHTDAAIVHISGKLKTTYPESTILEAIEKVKNEQK